MRDRVELIERVPIFQIDLDEEMVNGKKAAETGEVGGTASTSALPTGSATGSTVAAAAAQPAADGTAMDVDDPVPDASAKLSDSGSSSTIVIK